MSPIFQTAMAVSLMLLHATSTNAQSGSCAVALKTMTTVGCFSSADSLVDQGSYTFQSAGYCQCVCATLNKPVMATTKGSDCYCGDLLPSTGSAASNSSCNSPCNGYGSASCGGDGFWSVALTGTDNSVGSDSGSSSHSSSSSTTATPTTQGTTVTQTHAPSVITEAGQTIIVTASSAATASPAGSSNKSSGGGTSKAGIAAGVVVGVVLIAAIVGGVFFFLRHRRRRAVEEEYRRNAAASQFAAGKAKSETSSTSDQRLDPSVMSYRRQSIGSIADERDFSRRILQVRNPDSV